MYTLSQIFKLFPLLSLTILLQHFENFRATCKLAHRRLFTLGVVRLQSGFGLLTVGNPKIEKSKGLGFLTAILHLVPADISGFNVCQYATPGCKFSCLNKAGRGGMDNVIGRNIQAARYRKTRAFFEHRLDFMDVLALDIAKLCRVASLHNLRPAVRLNGTSDIPFEKIRCSNGKTLFELFPDVVFYDYSKNESRVIDFAHGLLPKNYHLTFSRSELTNNARVAAILAMGVSVAVPYTGDVTRLKRYLGLECCSLSAESSDGGEAEVHSISCKGRASVDIVDGDAHDLRFLDPKGSIVALTAKAIAKRDMSGFTVHLNGPDFGRTYHCPRCEESRSERDSSGIKTYRGRFAPVMLCNDCRDRA